MSADAAALLTPPLGLSSRNVSGGAGGPPRTSAGHAAARAATAGCTGRGVGPLIDQLVLHPPLRRCSPDELFAAVSAGSRTRQDGPFHMGACDVTWYSSAEACDVLQRLGVLVVQGDSLSRHLIQALLTILTGDYARGTSAFVGEASAQRCDCDAAYNDGHVRREKGRTQSAELPHSPFCRQHTVAHFSLHTMRGAYPSFCPAWNVSHLCPALAKMEQYPVEGACIAAGMAAAAAARTTPNNHNHTQPMLGAQYIAGGLHSKSLDVRALRLLFGRGRQRRRPHGNRIPQLDVICGLMHAPGGLGAGADCVGMCNACNASSRRSSIRLCFV